jgi:hypothetical protein
MLLYRLLLHHINPIVLCLVHKDLASATYKVLFIFNIFMVISILIQTIMIWAPFDPVAMVILIEFVLFYLPTFLAVLIWFFVLKKDFPKHQLEMDNKRAPTRCVTL